MIEKYQGYTEVRKCREGFRPAGNHPFKIIHNARVVKLSLIKQFESETGFIFQDGEKNALCTQPVPILGKELAVTIGRLKEEKDDFDRRGK